MNLHLTRHTGKLTGIVSINTSPTSNPFCKTMHSSQQRIVCSSCYACRLVAYRTKTDAAYERNSKLLSYRLLPLSSLRLPPSIPLVRLHSFGELINRTHARNFVRLATVNPESQFTLWTKRPELLYGIPLPSNFHVIYSIAQLDPQNPEQTLSNMQSQYSFIKAVYAVYTTKDVPPCGSSCLSCRRCYPPTPGDVIRQHLH